MSDAFIAYYGVRYTLPSDADVTALEEGTDARLRAANKARLGSRWGRLTDEGPYFLLIGAEITRLGADGQSEHWISRNELDSLMKATDAGLQQAGLEETAGLHFQLDSHP